MSKLKNYDVGVIIGRFQVPNLEGAHHKLIKEVVSRHKRCIILIGVSPTLGTKRHPLDYHSRALMIQHCFPNVVTVPILDVREDKSWSEHVDYIIRSIYPIGNVCIYGGRDSFINSYLPYGQFDTCELPAYNYCSATEIRRAIGKEVINNADFRKGIIFSTQNQYPKTFFTVDIAVIRRIIRKGNKKEVKVLLGRKKFETNWRFVGGFVDNDETLEEAAFREVQEEANITLDNIDYVCSKVVKDWRYHDSGCSVLTTFFCADYVQGGVKAGDDLEEIKWVNIENVKSQLITLHKVLLDDLCKYLERKEQ